MPRNAEQDAVWEIVVRLNAAWRAGHVDDLAPLFHEGAVILDGAHKVLAEGRAACVESYRAFVTSATVEAYAEGAPEVRVLGPMALVTYSFEMAYQTGGASYREAGSDALGLLREGALWQVVWRQLVWDAV